MSGPRMEVRTIGENTLNAKLSVYIEHSSNYIETTDSYCTDLTDCIERKTAVLFTVEKTL